MTPASLRCRACGAAHFHPVLSLGQTPLANALLSESDLANPEPAYPLDVVLCRVCTLVQITLSVPPERLFSDYAYFSSFSDAWVAHAQRLAASLIASRSLTSDSLVVEVASNDGYLLQHYQRAGIPVLGIEPAENIARIAESRGINSIVQFFGPDLAQDLRASGLLAHVIHASNVLAHVPDLTGVVRGFHTLLAPGGVVVVEAPYVRDMIDHGEFDTIYHEHLCYFSLTALVRLFAAQGLTTVGVERLATHGGSLRVYAERTEDQPLVGPSVDLLLREEAVWGIGQSERYDTFGADAARIRQDLVAFVAQSRAAGRRVAAYGAAAKGATMLNYAGLTSHDIDFVVDRNTYKHGRFMPGAHVPILPVEALLERQPDDTLLLTWNFADEILEQQAEYRRRGGRFVIAVPRLEIR
jgi:2-polyprenyl-3-methyl-5-hydroxy-6-metoxy-1,4-benzoquinol methylase